MLVSIFYFILAILGLGFLIFIHELGHYWMARRCGMRVESFGIGFGKPIYSFQYQGVKWNICWLPFGGYVKIAGMEKEGNKEPHEVEDGFFGKSPLDRIKVSIIGPLVNLACAFLLFCVLWLSGGRVRPFAEVTQMIGWVDPQSEMYADGIRPGDQILSYDGAPVYGFRDHVQAAMTLGDELVVQGKKWDPALHARTPFSFKIHPYPHPLALEKGILTTGVLSSANYILYAPHPDGSPNPLPKGSPLDHSGIQYGDAIVWMDGHRVYSLAELTYLLNDGRSLLTIRRGDQTLLRRVPRVHIEDLKLDTQQKEELSDWQWAARLQASKLQRLSFIPYNISGDGFVEGRLAFIDKDHEQKAFPDILFSQKEEPLREGDEIIAVDGMPVHNASELFYGLQEKKVLLAVLRKGFGKKPISWKKADTAFEEEISDSDIDELEKNIGIKRSKTEYHNIVLLQPIVPKTRAELFQAMEGDTAVASELAEERKQIQAIDDPEKRAQALKFLEKREQQLLLGLPAVQDMPVRYNPNPVVLFREVFNEVIGTLTALIGGYLNPKWLSGPVGIVQVIHLHWMQGVKEAIFWIATISLNLGLLNLLPLPVLDGGYICLSLFEMATGRRLKSKTIEKIVVPFAILLISFIVFLTYNDLLRIFSRFFN
jgi:regulator of sigma E protease